MTVNFNKEPVLLTVHGVQTGTNGDQNQHKALANSINMLIGNLGGGESDFPKFKSDIFRYEDINDASTKFFGKILASLTGNIVSGWLVDKATDIVGDVLLALSEDETYEQIKSGLKEKIKFYQEQDRPVYLVAHSLGSFYALDVVNDLMKLSQFQSNKKADWPIHGLVTIGSPLGLDLFKRSVATLQSRQQHQIDITDNTTRFPWRNFWDSQDPVVTGNLLGYPKDSQFLDHFDRQQAKKLGWDIRDRQVNSGNTLHLLAHIAYWESQYVAQGIVNLILRNWQPSQLGEND
jgi:hypothetical protein